MTISDENETEEAVISDVTNALSKSVVEIVRSGDVISTGSFKIKNMDSDAESKTVSGFLLEPEEERKAVEETCTPKLTDDGRYMLPKVVIGPDDRKRVTNTFCWPWSVHGHMEMRFPNGKLYTGTGTMVNKHHVLTAGHCIYSSEDGGWATRVSFEPARNDDQKPFGTHFANRLLSVKNWMGNKSSDWDYGMLILSSDLGEETGWKGIIAGPDRILNRYQVNVSGYPGDKGGYQMWTHADVIKSVARERFFYNIDTYGGQSGSGVWSTWTDHSGELVCGVHTTGFSSGNGATRISRPKFDQIVGWMSRY